MGLPIQVSPLATTTPGITSTSPATPPISPSGRWATTGARFPPTGPTWRRSSARARPLHPSLPQTITLPYRPSQAPYTRPGQFAGRLGLEHDPFFLEGTFNDPMRFTVPDLAVDAAGASRLADRRGLLDSLNRLRHDLDLEVAIGNYTRQQERTFDLLAASSTAGAFDIHREPEHVRALYGPTINGTSLLMARRLVEAGVPYITVFWSEEDPVVSKKCASGGGWDTHANNFSCLRENLLPEFDRAFAGLVGDLDDRGLLDSTLLLVSSEMGRKPKIGDPRSGAWGRRTRPLDILHERRHGRRRHPRGWSTVAPIRAANIRRRR